MAHAVGMLLRRALAGILVGSLASVHVVGVDAEPSLAAAAMTFTNQTGIGDNNLRDVFISGDRFYAATTGGLAIATDGGSSFTTKTRANGLGDNQVNAVYADASTIYAATASGLSMSTNAGTSFTTKTTANGLGDNYVRAVYVAGSTIYAGTSGGLSISTDGGANFANVSSGLGTSSGIVRDIFIDGGTIYAATEGGLSISADGGASFSFDTQLGNRVVTGVFLSGSTIYAATGDGLYRRATTATVWVGPKTTANGLGTTALLDVFSSANTIYAGTYGGLSISPDGGDNFTNYTTANGLGGNMVFDVTVNSGTVYVSSTGGLSRAAAPGPTTQTVTWSPTTAAATVDSPLTPSSMATTDGDGAITYAVTSHTTTTCTVDTNSGVLTYTGTGDCTVRATAGATSSYLQGTKDVTFTVTKAAQTVTWAPTTALTLPAATVTPSAATVPAGGGTIGYTVTSTGTTGCTFVSGQLAYTAIGDCTVRAAATSSDLYDAGYTDVTFTITRATPTLSWSPTTTVELPEGSTTFAAAAASGDGAITYAVTDAGTTGCSLPNSTSRVLSFTSEGSCQVTATVAQTDDYDQVTSVKTFAVSKAAQTVSWSPTSSLTLASLSASLGAASTSGDGALSYSVTSGGGSGCAFPDSSSPTLTYSSPGTCTVTATAASTTGYAQGTHSMPITITLATPTMAWAPTTTLTMPAATVTPTAATTTGDGAITYAVTSGSNCSVDTNTGALTYTAVGACQVTATSQSTSRYTAGSTAAIFTVALAPQSITAAATSTSLHPGGTASLTHSGSTGTGSVTWTRTSGAGVCSLSGTTVTAVGDGTCVLTVSIAADTTYAAASDTITLTVATPAPPGGGGSRGGGGSSGSTTSTPQDPSPGTPSSSGPEQDHGSATAETPQESVPGTGSPTRVIGLPPAPIQVKVTPLAKKTRAKVLVGLPTGSGGASVLSTVVVVRDANGKIVSRIELPVKKGQQQAEVIVPFIADGYTVNVYNVNEVGVSTGALRASPLIKATTITKRTSTGTPSLFGSRLGRPIVFAGGSAALDAGDRKQLRAIAAKAKKSTNRLFVTGFARKGGGPADELAALSTKRARAVATYLSQQGVRVWIRYWGAGSLNGTGKATDRRVEIRTSSRPIPRSLVP